MTKVDEGVDPGHIRNTLSAELDRLMLQRCPDCSGYGHTSNLCPTRVKVGQLRMGVREQRALVDLVRKKCRAAFPPPAIGTISHIPGKIVGTKRVRKRVVEKVSGKSGS